MSTFFIVWLVIAVIAISICGFMLYHTEKGGESKFYCKHYNRVEWNGWEKVIENFDTVEFKDHFEWEEKPRINCYVFELVVDDQVCEMHYWERNGEVSVHSFPGEKECLCGFDKYHQRIVKDMLCEKFEFMKEVMGREQDNNRDVSPLPDKE